MKHCQYLTNKYSHWQVENKMNRSFPLQPFLLPSRNQRLFEIAGRKTRSLTIVLDGVHDPHNLSAVVRSCEGFGILELHVVESHAQFRISTKVTQGAEKWIDIHCHPQPAACLETLAHQGFNLWVAQPNPKNQCVHELPFHQRLALVFGNEHAGISAEIQQVAKGGFHVPMYGFADSFNVSVATGIVLSAAVYERERRPQGHADLSSEEQSNLVADWQKRSVKHADKILARLLDPI